MEEREKDLNEVPKNEGPMEYEIGDKTYVQKPLVFGQIKQLTTLLKSIKWPDKLDVIEITETLTDVLPQAFAIVLIEKGKDSPKDLKGKNLKALEEELEFGVSTALINTVIEDFLSCNPINSLWDLTKGVVSAVYIPAPKPTLVENEQNLTESTGSTESSSTSVVETSENETKPSGDTP
jgi:hypothetical protein